MRNNNILIALKYYFIRLYEIFFLKKDNCVYLSVIGNAVSTKSIEYELNFRKTLRRIH